MDGRGHDKRRRLREVYDHPQPTPGIEILAVEALTTRLLIVLAVVGDVHDIDDRVDVVDQLWPTDPQMRGVRASRTTSRPSGSVVRAKSSSFTRRRREETQQARG